MSIIMPSLNAAMAASRRLRNDQLCESSQLLMGAAMFSKFLRVVPFFVMAVAPAAATTLDCQTLDCDNIL
ncbi:MAG TPA: hypothetical protein VLJ17_21845 [Xanthobacteraceae bacterium]|nr:hypothetical protein [Xanthobacteraceae bacterium]